MPPENTKILDDSEYYMPYTMDSIELVTRGEEETDQNLPAFEVRGGVGSGHHGHEGRPGEVGGSLPSGERNIFATSVMKETAEGYHNDEGDWKFKEVTREIRLCRIGRGQQTHYAIGQGEENRVHPNSASCGQTVRSVLRDLGGLKSGDQITCEKCQKNFQRLVDKGRLIMPVEPDDLTTDEIKQIAGDDVDDFADMVLSRQWDYYELKRGRKQWREARSEWLANEQNYKHDIESSEAEAWIDSLPEYDRSIIAHDLEGMHMNMMESMNDDETLDYLRYTRGFTKAINELRERKTDR